jgi:hypothetical protein
MYRSRREARKQKTQMRKSRRTPKKTPMTMAPTTPGDSPFLWWETTSSVDGAVVTAGATVVVHGVVDVDVV